MFRSTVSRIAAASLIVLATPGATAAASVFDHEDAEYSPAVPWSQIQGGPAHLGTSEASELAPPLEEAWRFTPDEGGGVSAPVIAGDEVFSLGRAKVYSVDLETGELNWSIDRNEGPVTAPAVFEPGGRQGGRLLTYVEGEGEQTQLTAVEVDTQKTAWTLALDEASLAGLAASGGWVFAATHDGTVTAVDAATGKPVWSRRPLKGPVMSAPAFSGPSGFLPVSSADDASLNLIAIDLASGEHRWNREVGLRGYASSVISVTGESVFAVASGTYSREVYALNPSDGTVQWVSSIRSPVFPFSGLAATGSQLFVADLSGAIYSFSAEDGSRAWDFQVNGTTQQRSAPVVVGGSVFAGFDDGRIVAVATEGSSKGHMVWSTDTGSGVVKLMAVAPDRLVAAIGGDEGGLVAFRHATDGEALLDVASPTEIDPVGVSLAYVGALVLVAGLALGFGRLLGDRLARAGAKGRDVHDDDEDDAEDDREGEEG